MCVTINEPRKYGHPGKIDHFGAVRYLDTSADGLDSAARDENDLIQKSPAGLDIQQPAGADRGYRRGCRNCRRRWRLRKWRSLCPAIQRCEQQT